MLDNDLRVNYPFKGRVFILIGAEKPLNPILWPKEKLKEPILFFL